MMNFITICSVLECARPTYRTGEMCRSHHFKLIVLPRHPPCSIEGCDEKVRQNNLCSLHGGRLRRFGDPLAVPKKPSLAERFWHRVIKSENPEGCWEWQGKLANGYGRLSINGKNIGVHVVAFHLEHGYWPEHEVLHECDNPCCVNPKHLRAGTHAENMRDAYNKGRSYCRKESERCNAILREHQQKLALARRKLTFEQAEEIRAKRLAGSRPSDLAAEYSVLDSTISQIMKRKIYKSPFNSERKNEIKPEPLFLSEIITEVRNGR